MQKDRNDPLDSFDVIRERDVDLALVLALRASADVRAFFASAVGLGVGHLIGAGNSWRASDGREVDVILIQECNGSQDTIEIENKIAAPFQDGQVESYVARARSRNESEGATGSSILFAPEAYIARARAESGAFDGLVTYEACRDLLTAEGPWGRSLALLLDHGIRQHRRRGSGAPPSEARTSFFNGFAALAAQHGLPSLDAQQRGAGAGFLWYPRVGTLRAPAGWRAALGNPGPALVAKFVHGHADIELSGAADALDLSAVLDSLGRATQDLDLNVAKGSARIRSRVPVLDPDLSLEDQFDDAIEFARSLADLFDWWERVGCDAVEAALGT